MTKISLLGGSDPARSSLASVQRRLNVYTEALDPKQGEPGQVTIYQTPGLKLLGTTPNQQPIRGLYAASNGDLYCAAGPDVYYIDKAWNFNPVGTMPNVIGTPVTVYLAEPIPGDSSIGKFIIGVSSIGGGGSASYQGIDYGVLWPVKMADNGTSIIMCDHTEMNGYSINMNTRTGLTPLYNPSASDAETTSSTGWLGSTWVDFSDTYLIANYLNTPTFYISNSEDIIFDPDQFAGKSAYPDILMAAVVQHRVVWLIGRLSTEVWYNTGGAGGASNFPFALMPGVAIDWGTASPWSIAKAQTQLFWLAQNQNGHVVVLRGKGYDVERISTHALEDEIRHYARVDDCFAYCYMQNGHSFYVMSFETADKTWAYDINTGQWHQRAWIDDNGDEHRQRSDMHAFAYGVNVVNDWHNGNLYALDLDTYTDNGQPIKRVITFPRVIDNEEGLRAVFRELTLEVDAGETITPGDEPVIGLRWSDDHGHTWSNTITMPLGTMGQYNKLLRWFRMGLARSRIYELEYTANAKVAIQGAFVDVVKAGA